MQKIKILPTSEIQKIAAGEVIERPANAIKELVENSIDAGAKNITIYLEAAGKKLIRIIDDGCGMSKADAYLCLEHHATSKINSVYDLNNISTFGFRGEALSSIASISKVKLTTKEKDKEEGISLLIDAGQIKLEQPSSCLHGTDIEIRDIFFNIPARFKFLKKNETEFRQILQIFQFFCISHKDIHFKLFHENKLIYNCPATDTLSNRVIQLWDHNLESNTKQVEIIDEKAKVSITGLISNHQVSRFNRSQIFFFVNNRYVKNQSLLKALLKGYANVLPKDKFPVGFIFINIPQDLIDVNVHPRKEEIQFIHPGKIESLIQTAVSKSLENYLIEKISKTTFEEKHIEFPNQSQFVAAFPTTFDFEQLPFFEPIENNVIDNSLELKEDSEKNSNYLDIQNEFIINEDLNDKKNNYKIIGQFKNCYILLESDDGLLLIDQHAAHERILYETFINKFNEVAKVKLIFPIIITLTKRNIETLLSHLEFLKNYGIEAEPFSENQLIIQSIPVHLKDVKLDEIINQLISWIEEYQHLDKVDFFKLINEKVCAQMACKAAVKSGDKLSIDQINQLLDDLQKTENRFACPHGRPTSWNLALSEIEKKFKRDYR